MRIKILLVTVTLLLSGCAGMINGTTDTIYVRSHVDGTSFYFNAREIGIGTSAIVVIPKKQLKTGVLIAKKKDCLDKSTPIATQFDANTLWDACCIVFL